MEKVIPHDDQAAEAQKKLADLEKKTGKKPNILVFLMDNVGYGDIGINGGGLLAGTPTPNIDRLGREGLHLLSTYSQPSCTPTRVTLLTGRLPMRTGALHPGFAGQPGVLEDETTVAQVLSGAGYVTQAIGKWHCGEDEGSQPQNVGFDDFYGFLGWSGLYTDWRDENMLPELGPESAAPSLCGGRRIQPQSRACSQGTEGREPGGAYRRRHFRVRRQVRNLLGKLHQEDGQERPAVLPVPLHARRPCEELPQRQVQREIAGEVSVQRLYRGDGRHPGASGQDPRRHRAA